jgi:hypothetical protein
MGVVIALVIGTIVAITPAAAADGYGARLCDRYIAGGAPCACVGPILEKAYSEDELDPALAFMKAFRDGISSPDQAAAQRVLDEMEAKQGRSTIEDWMKRYDGPDKEMAASCNWTW